MRPFAWLVAISSFTAVSHALPQLPHFELQQASSTNEAPSQRSIEGTCKRIAELNNLSNIATNQTLRDALLANKKIRQDQVDYIETMKDAINSELQDLNSNTTLTVECGPIEAHKKAVKDCKKLDKLKKLVEMASNKTAYDEHLAGELLNQKQMEQLWKNMENAEIKLQKLRTNSTLVDLCTNEIGLRQNGAVGQQAGDIGNVPVDNSGAISMSSSDATALRSAPWALTCALVSLLWAATVLL
ncbi:hypothetical protein C7974DRAFT_412614 [Boeremia exigua]|uniref:uncharacterized protein n=1 Tax=Boeremia exigua TaxID=749465 RepID=UPI001E8E6269|nr:uncharacterized protein C7974DRAFT_412614 [Boeremia exigua]KAH6633632.1 hypothetical protein C7974DRAFT_412614 [Boeremia exigua]